MPHKKNPILCERICGLARLLRGYVSPALENVALWHERDITHSSVERVIIPDATTALDYMFHLLDSVLGNLGVHPERMRKNLELAGDAVCSQRLLLTLADRIGSRDRAYAIVQKLAQNVSPERPLRDCARADATIKQYLSDEEIDAAFDWGYFLRRARTIMQRALAQK
jgi:adenylosuccinate lyase